MRRETMARQAGCGDDRLVSAALAVLEDAPGPAASAAAGPSRPTRARLPTASDWNRCAPVCRDSRAASVKSAQARSKQPCARNNSPRRRGYRSSSEGRSAPADPPTALPNARPRKCRSVLDGHRPATRRAACWEDAARLASVATAGDGLRLASRSRERMGRRCRSAGHRHLFRAVRPCPRGCFCCRAGDHPARHSGGRVLRGIGRAGSETAFRRDRGGHRLSPCLHAGRNLPSRDP